MKNAAIFLLFFSTHALFGQSIAFEQMLNLLVKKTVSPIKIAEASVLKNSYFFDTRTKREFDVSHIKNAQWIGYEEFNIKKLRNIPKNASIILYCSVGARSEQIGEKLQKAGYNNVKNLWGGLFQWVNENKPIVDRANKPTLKVHAYSPEWGIWLQKGEKLYQ